MCLDDFTKSTKLPFHWKCHLCGYLWKSSIYSRTYREHVVCPNCERAKRKETHLLASGIALKTTLAQGNPVLVNEWNKNRNPNLTPNDVTCNTTKKVWWLCHKCGYEWQASIANRNRGAGCPACKHQVLVCGINDLATKYPQIAMEWSRTLNNGLTANQVLAGGHTKYWWKCCHCGFEWKAEIIARVRGTNCPNCSFSLHTSLPEQILYFFLAKKFENVINHYKPEWLNGREIDIFLPSLKVGIEYDGSGWHQSIEKDTSKSELIHQHEISLIRIREPKCPEINDGSTQIITSVPDKGFVYLDNAISDLYQLLNKQFHLEL